MKVFCSGSCRLLTAIRKTNEIEPIHSLETHNFKGIHFLGKFHDTKSHIQFVRFIKGEIQLEEEQLKNFFTSYNSEKWETPEFIFYPTSTLPTSTLPTKVYHLQQEIENCEAYIFEVCSIKTYKYKGTYCQFEQKPNNDTREYEVNIQTEKELLEDLHVLTSFFPGKKIIFQCHFRPNIIYSDETKSIAKRELIYNTLNTFCQKNENCFLYDPSILLKNNALFDGDTHFNSRGYEESFNFLHEHFLRKSTV